MGCGIAPPTPPVELPRAALPSSAQWACVVPRLEAARIVSVPLSLCFTRPHCSFYLGARALSRTAAIPGGWPSAPPLPPVSAVGSRCLLAAAPEVRRGQVVCCGHAPAAFRSCQRPACFTAVGRCPCPALRAGLPLGVRCWPLLACLAPSRCASHAAAAAGVSSACAQWLCVGFFSHSVCQPLAAGAFVWRAAARRRLQSLRHALRHHCSRV